MVKIITTVIEAEFAFFQVMIKFIGTKAVELCIRRLAKDQKLSMPFI